MGFSVLGLHGQFEASQGYMSSSLKTEEGRGGEGGRQRVGIRIEKMGLDLWPGKGVEGVQALGLQGANPACGRKIMVSLGLYSWPSLASRTGSHPQLPKEGRTLVGSVGRHHFYPLAVTADGQELH